MAFSFGGNSAFGASSGGAGGTQTHPAELAEISTEGFGFTAINGESKLKLLPSEWPSDNLPPPTSSLLSVSSNKGLLAAAGPESVVIASTEAVRKGFEAPATSGVYRSFAPQLTLPIGTRISQVAFSADGGLLVLSAEAGGGLAIYDTGSLLQGNTQSAFELSTGGNSVRALTPNPAVPELFAVVTVTGELMIANMSNRQFAPGPNGQVLQSGVSCVSWSNKGKQLVAGLGNGTATQLKPDGTVVAEIPRPTGLEGDQHISAISWLADNTFLIAYTPSAPGDGMAPQTDYYIVNRQTNAPFAFSKLPEVCSPFGLNRSPAFQFMQRLRNFDPNLKDVVIVASTASQDIGIFTKSDKALTSDVPADQIQNQYTTTNFANDSRRAQLPMTDDLSTDTSAIGMALDLSSTSKVLSPIPGHELEESKGPLPALLILNNQGVLCGWWVVYNDSVLQGLTYSGIAAAQGQQVQTSNQPAPSAFGTPSAMGANTGQSAFGQSSFSTSSTASPFGDTNKTPSFGTTSTPGASTGLFGNSSGLGNKSSLWGSSTQGNTGGSAFGQPAFGSTSSIGASAKPAFGSASSLGANAQPAFGSSGGLGAKASPWGGSLTSSPAASGAVFGQSSGMGAQKPAAFGSTAPTTSAFGNTSTNTSGGFASFASSGGFASSAAAATPKADGGSIFGKPAPPSNPFAAASAFTQDTSMASTPKKDDGPGTGLFGAPKDGFSIGSAWKNPNAGKADEKTTQKSIFGSSGETSGFFGSGFGKAIDEASKTTAAPVSAEADMTSDAEEGTKEQDGDPKPPSTTTPADTPAATKFFPAPPASSGLYGTQSQNQTTPAAVQKSEPTALSWGKPFAAETPKAEIPIIKEEPKDESEKSKVSESTPQAPAQAPLPPDTTSKATYTPGTSSSSSIGAPKNAAEDAPLPPDFLKPSSKPKAQFEFDDAPLPPNFAPTVANNKSAKPPAEAPQGSEPTPSTSQIPASPEATSENLPLPDDKDDEDLDDEGSGVDVAQELSPTTDQSPKVTPESSFGQKLDKGSLGGSFAKINDPQAKPPSKPLFGELGTSPAPFFPPPPRTQQSPRSPSPVRRAIGGNLMRPDNSRSVSAPGVPLRNDTSRKVTLGRPMPEKAVYPPQVSIDRQQREERELQARKKAQAQAEEEQELSDDEDENIRYELNSEIEILRELGEFLAHEDYAGKVTKPGIPGQIEKVYRDINAMVDVLGLNSRRLQGWIKGQEELIPDEGRTRDDLDRAEDWCLDEVGNLAVVQSELHHELAEGRLDDVPGKLNTCYSLSREVEKLKAKRITVMHMIEAKKNPGLLEMSRRAPLSPEQESIRRDLRKAYTDFQKVLARAEEKLSELQTNLVKHSAATNKSKGLSKVPTVEAVEKTILKMTSMVEKKSGDIDFLETQMRKLGVRGDSPASREGSPFVTPPTSAKKSKALARTPGSSVNGNGFYTPPSARSRFATSVSSNVSELGRSPRKKMSEVSQYEAAQYAAKASHKKQMHSLLKEALVKGEVRVRSLDE